MSDRALEQLAKRVGLVVDWIDAWGQEQSVCADTLRSALRALSLPADNAAQIKESRDRLKAMPRQNGKMLIADAGKRFALPGPAGQVRFVGEDANVQDRRTDDDARVRAPGKPGYYRLECGTREYRLAVAPPRALTLDDIAPGEKLWAVAAQIYALRGGTTAGFGDFAALAEFAADAAGQGADGVAISPVHALFGADFSRASPYAPSSRLFLNPLYAAIAGRTVQAQSSPLVDWASAGAQKRAALEKAYARILDDVGANAAFKRFIRRGGARLLSHARFEVLDARHRAQGLYGWRQWPDSFRNARSRSTRCLKAGDRDVSFQLFLQWLADSTLEEAQSRAKQAGMRIGLIADLAIGMDLDGSHAWHEPDEVLLGLNVGAPPDTVNAMGQNWGLTNFSPLALRQSGYAGFIATLRAAMRHAGGIRLDHAMGLQRLWVIPEGASAQQGVYLRYPLRDMLRLIALESVRNRAIVIAEDLGTVPHGFRARITRAGLYGMRILWFERDAHGRFMAPDEWEANAAALSTTHDLPTIAGWWRARDIAWKTKLGIAGPNACNLSAERRYDRSLLWQALTKAGCADGPEPEKPAKVIDAVCAFVGKTASALAIVPAEDFAGMVEQPNLPGTVDGHPNWRRRYARTRLFEDRKARKRAVLLNKARSP